MHRPLEMKEMKVGETLLETLAAWYWINKLNAVGRITFFGEDLGCVGRSPTASGVTRSVSDHVCAHVGVPVRLTLKDFKSYVRSYSVLTKNMLL